MAVYEDSEFFAPRRPAIISIIAYRIADLVDQALIGLRQYIVRTQTERALAALPDRLLADIGVARYDIASFSVKAAEQYHG